ncbi:hypothetical protein HMPREF1527_01003 [Atopobium sp. oral taxon 199 str. F0494]|nr:hypothetical protein HMPREF1527_01003 [Atopobium sp. oral taxon 199 str. F0494]
MPVRDPLWLLPPGPDQVRGVTSPVPAKRAVDTLPYSASLCMANCKVTISGGAPGSMQ